VKHQLINKEAGYSGVVIVGEPTYYPKVGFVTCDKFGIADSEGRNFDAFMCLPLDEEVFCSVRGKYVERSVYREYDKDEEEIKQMELEFPSYRKIKIKDGFFMILDNSCKTKQ
jgi:hypothetical protein